MIGNSIVADTNIYIDVMKGEKAVAERLKLFSEVYLSPIVLAELYFGAYRSASPQKHLSKISIAMRDSKLLSINGATSELFVKIKVALFAKGKPIPENDIWIAASSLQYNLPLFTSDKHFNEIEGLSLLK